MSFSDLNLNEEILKAIKEIGYTTPTPIQQEAIPLIMSGRDLRASAQTGTGKTAAFILPALNRLATKSKLTGHGPRVLILVPTRELAMQVAAEAEKYSKYMNRTTTVCIYGGAPYPVQNRQLSRPYEILVATPGRLIDHMERGRIKFSRLEMLVLDEADRMLDMGFIEPVEQIAAATPEDRQTLMFSATLKGPVMKLSNSLLTDPLEVSVAEEHAKHENIEQRLHYVDGLSHKHRLLDHLLELPMQQTIIFTSTKVNADELVDRLLDQGLPAAALHGDMNQRQRTSTIKKMHKGDIRILVATDVAARGIDVPAISHVINFDLPNNAEDYVHRIGRTGRAGAKGIALSFAAPKDTILVKRIEQFTGHKMVPHVIAGMEPAPRKESSRGEGKRPSRFNRSRNSGGQSRGGHQDSGNRPGSNRQGHRDSRNGSPRSNNSARNSSGPRHGGGRAKPQQAPR